MFLSFSQTQIRRCCVGCDASLIERRNRIHRLHITSLPHPPQHEGISTARWRRWESRLRRYWVGIGRFVGQIFSKQYYLFNILLYALNELLSLKYFGDLFEHNASFINFNFMIFIMYLTDKWVIGFFTFKKFQVLFLYLSRTFIGLSVHTLSL